MAPPHWGQRRLRRHGAATAGAKLLHQANERRRGNQVAPAAGTVEETLVLHGGVHQGDLADGTRRGGILAEEADPISVRFREVHGAAVGARQRIVAFRQAGGAPLKQLATPQMRGVLPPQKGTARHCARWPLPWYFVTT